jgi:ABC-type Na+ transport system ATPase subunit NatA
MLGLRPKTGLAHPTSDSDIEVADVQRVLLDEVAAGFDVVARQHAEDFITGVPDFF